MAFRVGMKVVCIKEIPFVGSGLGESYPKYRETYTVRCVEIVDGDEFIRLNEIRNPVLPYAEGFFECTFWAAHFRPIVERKTDISALKALLVPGTKILEGV